MVIEIKPEVIKEIAENLDIGMVCFYHKTTGELEFFPDESRNPGYDKEFWLETIIKVDENYADYLRFESMPGPEAFKIMEAFINNISHIHTHNSLTLFHVKKPFSQFNNLLFRIS